MAVIVENRKQESPKPSQRRKLLAINGEPKHFVGDTQAFLAVLEAIDKRALNDLTVVTLDGEVADRYEAALPHSSIKRVNLGVNLHSKFDRLAELGLLAGRMYFETFATNPAAILTYDRTGAVDVAAWVARTTDTPVIEHLNNNQMFDLQRRRYNRLEQAGAEYWSCSDYVRNNAIDAGLKGVHTTIMNAVNIPPSDLTQEEARRKLNLPLEAIIATIVGRYSPFKGQETAIAAMDKLRDIPNLHLVMAGYDNGDGKGLPTPIEDYEQYLAKMIVSLGLQDRIHVIGKKPGQEVFRAGDFALAPSTEEPFGLVVAEAMSSKRAVIATDTGAFPDLITHNQTGILVPVGNSDMLAAEMKRLYLNPNFRQELATNASIRVMPLLTPTRLGDDVENALQDFMARHYSSNHHVTA